MAGRPAGVIATDLAIWRKKAVKTFTPGRYLSGPLTDLLPMSEKIVLWSDGQPLSLSLVPRGGSAFSIRAAGSSFHQPFLRSLNTRIPAGRELLAWLWPEPENPFHGRAIRFMAAEPLTRLSGQAGYLPREVAERWFPFVRGFQLETGSLPAFPARFTSSAPGSPQKGLEFVAPEPNEWMESVRVAA